MKRIIIWGSTGHAVVLEEFLPAVGYTIVALFDNNKEVRSISTQIPIFYGPEGFKEWMQGKER